MPVNEISKSRITALKYFENASYIDFGWGEEVVYQTSHETFCMDLKAVTIPSSSVMRVEGVNISIDSLVAWSYYAVLFRLTEDEFSGLCHFIDASFTRGDDRGPVKTSERSGGDIIYFQSVHTYCLFNTCNTWVADALSQAVPGISPFLVITKNDLYDAVKGRGAVLKSGGQGEGAD